jgi:hypothetical protein
MKYRQSALTGFAWLLWFTETQFGPNFLIVRVRSQD